jgi:hypothetical protein
MRAASLERTGLRGYRTAHWSDITTADSSAHARKRELLRREHGAQHIRAHTARAAHASTALSTGFGIFHGTRARLHPHTSPSHATFWSHT